MEEIDFNEEWRKERNAMIQMLICGVIIGFCLGLYV
jgi:hypothetical protein